jgi:hypothetical protein
MGTNLILGKRLVIAILLVLGWFSVSANRMAAQSAGNKAVYNSVGPTNSQVWVDLSAWWNLTLMPVPDLCGLLNTFLTSSYGTYPNGAVIDARGLTPVSPSQGMAPRIICSENPFKNVSSLPSTTILLPSGYIYTASPWIIPSNTRLVGDAKNGTLIIADPTNWSGGNYILEMGSSTLCPSACTSIGIEHIFLGSSGFAIGAIHNGFAQAGSYVNDVTLSKFPNNAIVVESGATNSGPYSNINAKGEGAACIDLEVQTQGIHGVTCFGANQPTVPAGIIVNGSNNSIEDVHIEQYGDGIEIGSALSTTVPTVSNILVSNVTTDPNGYTQNAVHLCGNHPLNTSSACICFRPPNSGSCSNVQDVTLLNVANPTFNVNNESGNAQNNPTPAAGLASVIDDVSGNAIVGCYGTAGCAKSQSTGIYALGENEGGSNGIPAYSKFAVNPSTPGPNANYYSTSSYVPTWGVGTATPETYCSPVGAIYSQTGVNGSSVWVCIPVSGQTYGEWAAIP